MQEQKKILIAEDEAPLRGAVKDILLSEKFQVFEAANGKDGLEISLREHPDLILLDLNMPIVNGFEMLEKLREDAWGKTVIVLPLTNDASPEAVVRMSKLGATEFCVKSDWNIEDVVKKIKAQLGM